MKCVLRLILFGFVVMLIGCSSVSTVQSSRFELKMLPEDVALQIIRRYSFSAEKASIEVVGSGPGDSCKARIARIPYSELNFFSYFKMQRSTFALITSGNDPLSFCKMGIYPKNLSRDDALELAGALNSLGARIPVVLLSE